MRCRSTSRGSVAALAAAAALLLAAPAAHAEEPQFSASASALSDTTVAIGVLTPIALQVGGGLDEAAGVELLLYGEAMGLSIGLNQVVKRLARVPRPYTRSTDQRIIRFSKSRRDSNLSFYSGHASAAFTAAVAGSLLFDGEGAGGRAAVWGFNMALAGATANLRVRAGKHYPVDVMVGALLGTMIGVAVPALQDDDVSPPSLAEWGAIGGGLLVGVVGSQLIPVRRDILEPLEMVTPVAYQGGGGGLVFAGTF
jgi:membrane-associated phospholipid phosphatase